MSTDERLVDARTLVRREPRFGSAGIPRGWFVVAFSDEITPGRVHRLRYFGRDLIAYRGASGRAYVAGAYCPHLGAHLGHGGKIEGETIRCPFHGWRFDGDGRCAAIPYGDKIPPRARLGALPVREQNGVVHAFVDPTDAATEPFALPTLDEAGWTEGRTITWRALATHPQEVFENTVDTAHIGPIHDGRGAKLGGKPTFDGARMHVDVEFQAPGDIVGMPDQLNDVHLSVTLHGLGVVFVETHVRNVGVRARQRIYVTPVDEESVDIRAVVHVREQDDPAFTAELAQLFYDAYVEDFARDFPIWENKRYLSRPQLAKGDGPIGAYRKWCTQFYAARPEAPSAAPPRSSSLRERVVELARRVRAQLADADENLEVVTKEGPRPPAAAVAQTKPTLRVRTASDYFDTLPQRFASEAARGVDAVVQWELGGAGGRVFHAHVRDGSISVLPGPHDRPNVALVMPAEDYVRVVNGELDGMRAFTSGRGRVKGSIPLAMKMRTLFPA
jgi:phenylpropionate dioxygenase-like ring-hydroxylating dioxygenase large terminal subunit/putative sterol carrier protein